jgi:hypothetical protein
LGRDPHRARCSSTGTTPASTTPPLELPASTAVAVRVAAGVLRQLVVPAAQVADAAGASLPQRVRRPPRAQLLPSHLGGRRVAAGPRVPLAPGAGTGELRRRVHRALGNHVWQPAPRTRASENHCLNRLSASCLLGLEFNAHLRVHGSPDSTTPDPRPGTSLEPPTSVRWLAWSAKAPTPTVARRLGALADLPNPPPPHAHGHMNSGEQTDRHRRAPAAAQHAREGRAREHGRGPRIRPTALSVHECSRFSSVHSERNEGRDPFILSAFGAPPRPQSSTARRRTAP